MANTKAAKKYAKVSAVRATRNRSVRSAVKTFVAKARRAVTEGGEDALKAVVTATSVLDRAASKGILHPNNAARRKSRLMKRVATAAAPAPAAAEKTVKKATKPGATKAGAKPAPGGKKAAPRTAAKAGPKSRSAGTKS